MQVEKLTDVCIIGSGPAGAATSMMLSKLKIKHIIIDKETFPRDKICGDGLILYTFQVLKAIDPGLLEKFINHPAFIHTQKGVFHVNNVVNFSIKVKKNKPFPPIYYGKRIDFDHFLVENLVSDYATVIHGVQVKNLERTSNQTVHVTLSDQTLIEAKMVVGAEGIYSLVSKKLALNKFNKNMTSAFVSAYFEAVDGLPVDNQAEIRIVNRKMPLFFYIFPLPNGQVNVSCGGASRELGKYKINLIEEAERILETHSKVKSKFTHAKRIGNWRGWSIPNFFGQVKTSGDQFLLVGDAAGLANPFYKEGVGTSMMSGVLAAKQIKLALDQQRFDAHFLQDYDTALHENFGKLLKYSALALRLSRYPIIFGIATGILKRKIENGILRVIDRQTYTDFDTTEIKSRYNGALPR